MQCVKRWLNRIDCALRPFPPPPLSFVPRNTNTLASSKTQLRKPCFLLSWSLDPMVSHLPLLQYIPSACSNWTGHLSINTNARRALPHFLSGYINPTVTRATYLSSVPLSTSIHAASLLLMVSSSNSYHAESTSHFPADAFAASPLPPLPFPQYDYGFQLPSVASLLHLFSSLTRRFAQCSVLWLLSSRSRQVFILD